MIYFDNSASTRVYDHVAERMVQIMSEQYGNASALHAYGAASERLIQGAREQIASVLRCAPGEVFFTGSGTEANNMALLGAARAHARRGKHILTSPLEHASVTEPLKQLEAEGFTIEIVPIDDKGHISAATLGSLVRSDTILVSIMQTSNEIGALQPVGALVQAVKRANPATLFHTDAVQGFAKNPLNLLQIPIDLLSASAHKLHGPKGVGCLFIRKGVRVLPIQYGGGHEGGYRSGTQATEAISGFGLAAVTKWESQLQDAQAVNRIRERMMNGLTQFGDDVVLISPHDVSTDLYTPYILTIGFSGVKSEVLLHHLAAQEIYCSSGSACSSHKKEKSKTLTALGVQQRYIDGAIRFSWSAFNTESEADTVLAALADIYPKVRYDKKQNRQGGTR